MTNRNRKIRTKMRIERDRRRRNQVHSSSILREASFLLMFLIILGLLVVVMGASNRKMEALAAPTKTQTALAESVGEGVEQAEELPPDAIWITREQTVAPDQGIPMVEPVPNGHWVSAGKHRITHYCPGRCCNGANAGRTALGAEMVTGRTVAASSKEFPFGTRLLIGGHEYVVEDRGVGYGQIDVLVNSHCEALNKGLYYTDIHVWKEY